MKRRRNRVLGAMCVCTGGPRDKGTLCGRDAADTAEWSRGVGEGSRAKIAQMG